MIHAAHTESVCSEDIRTTAHTTDTTRTAAHSEIGTGSPTAGYTRCTVVSITPDLAPSAHTLSHSQVPPHTRRAHTSATVSADRVSGDHGHHHPHVSTQHGHTTAPTVRNARCQKCTAVSIAPLTIGSTPSCGRHSGITVTDSRSTRQTLCSSQTTRAYPQARSTPPVRALNHHHRRWASFLPSLARCHGQRMSVICPHIRDD